MFTFLGLICVFSTVASQQIVNRVSITDPRGYMVNVIHEVMNTVEERGWCNLKLPELQFDIHETIFTKNYTGTATYKNGFLVSIQQLDVISHSLQQIWNVTDGKVRVSLQGLLRMTDAALGYDIETDISDGVRRYTGLMTQPQVIFNFTVLYWPVTHERSIVVTGNQTRSNNVIDIMPRDPTSDALTTLVCFRAEKYGFNPQSTLEGIKSWATDIFQTIGLDVVNNRVAFPKLCYNCPLT